MSSPRGGRARSELTEALAACRNAFGGLALLSAVLNVLLLGGSFFMMLVYDRVLPSGSVPTLVGLLLMVSVVYFFQAVLELIRGRVLVHVSSSLEEALGTRVYDIIAQRAVRSAGAGDGLQPVRDLDTLRAFLSSSGPAAFFDMPFLVLFLTILFGFHVLLGLTALIGALVLTALTVVTDRMTRGPTQQATGLASARNALAEASRRNAEVLQALGMTPQGRTAWSSISNRYIAAQDALAGVAGRMGSVTRVLRMLLQSLMLAVGAYLVIKGEASGGVIIASSILSSRALAPVETVIANWKGLVQARQSWARLNEFLAAFPPEAQLTPLPPPTATLSVEHVSAGPPGVERLTIADINLQLKAGEGLGIIGPSASGKSSLVRTLVGVWRPLRGKVRLDGAALDQWSTAALGRHLGYLPQDVELFDGTIARNISRFEADADPEAIFAAARGAGVHDLILRLPAGYETDIGPNGRNLSAGQRQRIALARALYGDPFLVVLDEPNSNLDGEGENALSQAIVSVRARGGIAVVVAHRPSALASVDLLMVMGEGRVQAFGPKDEVLKKMTAPLLPKAADVA